MANFLKKVFRAYGPDRVQATAQFTTAGTAAPAVFNLHGVVSVVRTGVGLFTVTMMDSAKEYHITLGQQCTPALSAAQCFIGVINAAAKTITINVATAGAAADTTGITIYLTVVVRTGN
jgi:hypothetical protein